MMRVFKILYIAGVYGSCTFNFPWATAEDAVAAPPIVQPIAFVDLDVVLDSPSLKRFKDAQAQPPSPTAVKRQPEYAQLVKSVETLEQLLLAPELEPEKRPALIKQYIEANRALRSRIEVEKLRPSLQFAFKQELAAVIKQLAINHKISVVVYRTKNERPPNEETQNLLRNPIVYTDPALDITPLVIEQLEKTSSAMPKPGSVLPKP